MKNVITLLTLLLSYSAKGQFHIIKQRELGQGSLEKSETLSFCVAEQASEFKKWNAAPNIWLDMGVLKVTYYNDKDSNEVWRVKVVLDDEYKDNYPTSYTFAINEHLVLFYEADSLGREIKREPNSDILNEWTELISDRVYRKNREQNYRYVNHYDTKTNKRVLIKAYYLPEDKHKNPDRYQWRRTAIQGNPFNEIHIKFSKDGTLISKTKPA